MTISFYGENCFKIQTGEFVILTDPFDQKIGLTVPRFKYDALVKTISAFPLEEEENSAIKIYGPGEYNFNGINAFGFLLEKESGEKFIKTVFILDIEEIKIAFLGHISEIPDPAVMEKLEEIDILFVPGGGKPFIDQKSAKKIIKQIQPKIVIPTLYKIPGLKRTADDIKVFLEEVNHGKTTPQEKLTIKKKDLAGMKQTQVVVIKI